MPNPPTSATYTMTFGRTTTNLTLNFDNQWNIVNSKVGSSPIISGSYNPSTGEITFAAQLAGVWPSGLPSFLGYYFLTDGDPGVEPPAPTFAGVFDETFWAVTGIPPNLTFQLRRVENGWVAGA